MRNVIGIALLYLAIFIAMCALIAFVQWNCGVSL